MLAESGVPFRGRSEPTLGRVGMMKLENGQR